MIYLYLYTGQSLPNEELACLFFEGVLLAMADKTCRPYLFRVFGEMEGPT